MPEWTTCAHAVDEATRRAHEREAGELDAVDAMLTEVCTEQGLNKDVVLRALEASPEDRTREMDPDEAHLDAVREEIEHRVDQRRDAEISRDTEWTVYEELEGAIRRQERDQVTAEQGVALQDLYDRDDRLDDERDALREREVGERFGLDVAPF